MSVRLLCIGIVLATALGGRADDEPSAAKKVATPNESRTFVWQTTYDGPEWKQSMGLAANIVNCDGLSGNGGWTTAAGSEEQITAAANHPAGGGGRGQRHWIGDGTNNGSGGMRISLGREFPQLWVRWYMRYQQGFAWEGGKPHYNKWLYFNVGGSRAIIPSWSGGRANIWKYHSPQNHTSDAFGWRSLMNGEVSDGAWHCYEVHLKVDTNRRDGIGEMWVDGAQVLRYADIDFGNHAGWTYFVIASNHNRPANGADFYQDFDDFAVSDTGYIGPIAATAPPPAK